MVSAVTAETVWRIINIVKQAVKTGFKVGTRNFQKPWFIKEPMCINWVFVNVWVKMISMYKLFKCITVSCHNNAIKWYCPMICVDFIVW